MTGTPTPRYAAALALTAAPATAAQLAYYSNDARSVDPVLAPRGWKCTAIVAADGSTGIDVYPSGQAAPVSGTAATGIAEGVTAASTSACQGCADAAVCRFIPGVAHQLGYRDQDIPCPPAPAAERVTWIRGSPTSPPPVDDAIGFLDPPGIAGTGSPSGGLYPANGAVLYVYTATCGGTASTETCTLPDGDHALCTVVLNDFIARRWMLG